MKEHCIRWYETDDGRIFINEMDAYDYEANLLYKESGVKLYNQNDAEITEIKDPETYDLVEYITIDHSKEDANRAFSKCVYETYGWVLLSDAIESSGSKYKICCDHIEELDA